MAKFNYRIFGRVFLVAICLLLLTVFLQPILRLVGAHSTSLTSYAPPPAELDPITLYLTLNETEDIDNFAVGLDRIQIPYTETLRQSLRGDQICIQSLFLDTLPFISEQEYGLQDVCTNKPTPWTWHYTEPTVKVEELQDSVYGMLVEYQTNPIGQSDFFFPFDRRSIRFAVSLIKVEDVFDDAGTRQVMTEIAPRTHITLSSQKWEAFVETIYDFKPYLERNDLLSNDVQIDSQLNDSDSTAGDELELGEIHFSTKLGGLPTTIVDITLQRPLAQRLLTPVLLGGLLIFILLLVFIHDHGASLEVAIGILLGLWGVQDILIPSYIIGPTFIEVIILTLYILLVFAIFVRFVIKPFWNRLGPSGLVYNGSESQLSSGQEAEGSRTLSSSPPVLLDSPHSNHGTMWHNLVIIILAVILTFIGLIQYIRNKIWSFADK